MYPILPSDSTEDIAWKTVDANDLWALDKLIFSRRMGYKCGPSGMSVPVADRYIVRPCVNLFGMGRGARIESLESSTDHLEPGYFWCELFYGRHCSIDYEWGEPILSVQGYPAGNGRFDRWEAWYKTDRYIPLPKILKPLAKKHRYLNVEFIDSNPIEVHFRQNPDWQLASNIVELRPVWRDAVERPRRSGFKFIKSPDGDRLGFWVKTE